MKRPARYGHAAPELLSPSEMGEADRRTVEAGVSVETLMENAGRAAARAIRARMAPARTLVLCGPGNNGGDGYVVARHLEQAGWPVRVAALAPASGAAGWAASRWRGPVEAIAAESVARADLVVDALFGAGLSRDLDGIAAAALRLARRVVAIDVPSGLDGATGQVRGFAPQAVLTVTFFRAKPGHFLLPGRDLCGELVVADIGLSARVLDTVGPTTFRNGPGLWTLPEPGASAHKYTRGHVTVLGGPAMTGAARLAAMAARRAGAGMVTIATEEGGDLYRAGGEAGVIVDSHRLEDLIADVRRNAWVCGPGLGTEGVARALPALLASGHRIVVDADALTACAGAPERLNGAAVLTPHAGEFARVFGDFGPDRLAAARAAAARAGCVLLLKGSDTVIASPDGRAAINANAPPWLATAGAGDVLSGIVAALLAQGMPAWEAACAAAWLHGRAAEHAGEGLIAEDLPPMLPRAAADSRRVAFVGEPARVAARIKDVP